MTATAHLDSAGLFTQDQTGCGPGAVQNVRSDGNVVLNTRSQSASPGDYLTVYGTGLGPVYDGPRDGSPAGTDPFAKAWGNAFPVFGYADFGQFAGRPVLYTGRAPGLVGVDQVNFQIPANAPEGCSVPLYMEGVIASSQPVLVSIRRGGGQCQDPPAASTGRMRWLRRVVTGPEPAARSEEQTFTASIFQAPENLLRPPGAFRANSCTCFASLPRDTGARCQNAEPERLNGGTLTLQPAAGQALSASFTPGAEWSYRASAPSGVFAAGRAAISSAGGAEVGPFSSAITIPPPIEITTDLTPGARINNRQPFRFTWRNGAADSVVRMRMTQRHWAGGSECECNALATAGELTLPMIDVGTRYERFPLTTGDTVVTVTVEPAEGKTATFQAQGLTLGGTHDWRYEYVFRGVRVGLQ